MAEVRLSSAAQADFDAVIDHLADVAGKRVAAEYADRLDAALGRIAEFPGIGATRQHLGAQTRIVVVSPYVIFYDGGPDSPTVDVLRILHGHRHITPELIARGRRP